MTPKSFSASVRENLRVQTATTTHFFVDDSSQLKEGEKSDMQFPPPIRFAVCAMRIVWILPCYAHVSTVATNSNETTLEADLHANTTCIGWGP